MDWPMIVAASCAVVVALAGFIAWLFNNSHIASTAKATADGLRTDLNKLENRVQTIEGKSADIAVLGAQMSMIIERVEHLSEAVQNFINIITTRPGER